MEILGFNDDFETGRRALNISYSSTSYNNIINSNITYGVILSGNTIYSGASDLSYIFAPINTNNSYSSFSATTLSGGSIFSGTTNLSSVFAPIGLSSPFSGNSNNGAIKPISGTNIASGAFSFVSGGKGNTASGSYSQAGGNNTLASGAYSQAGGYNTLASGIMSHAEGEQTSGTSRTAHSEGKRTIASGTYSHAEGHLTSATTTSSHAQNRNSLASGVYSHAGGSGSTASGHASFIHSSTSSVLANNSSILGGFANRLNSAATGSTILGGSNITGSTVNTVYVPNLTASTSVYAQNFYSGNTNISTLISQASSYISGTTTSFSLASGYSSGGSLGYRKDSFGYVHFKGLMAVGSIGGNNTFDTLPAGFRPSQAREFSVVAAGPTGGNFVCVINSSGDCQIVNPDGTVLNNGDNVYLDGVSFYLYD